MKKNNKRKANKKIVLAFLMLVLTAIALTTASYAWFSANTNITLGSLDVYVQASSGIQISMDAEEWNSSLTTAQIWDASYTGSANQFSKILSPVSTAGLDSDSDGYVDMFLGALNDEGNAVTLVKQTEAQTTNKTAENARGSYIAFDLFVQSTSQQNVYLQGNSTVFPSNVNGFYGAINPDNNLENVKDQGLKSSIRVGFFNKGAQSDYDQDNAKTLTPSQFGEDSSLVGIGDFHVWQPNANIHTKVATNNGASGVTSDYLGAFKATSGEAVALNAESNFKTIHTVTSNYTDSPSGGVIGVVGQDYMFQLNPGINKIRIYIWVEGQDEDCENTASTGSGVRVSLYLTAK